MTQPPLMIQTLLDAASLKKSPLNMMVSVAPASTLICRENTAPSKLVLLMCAFSHRKSSAVTQATPCARCCRLGSFMALVMTNTVGFKPGGMA